LQNAGFKGFRFVAGEERGTREKCSLLKIERIKDEILNIKNVKD
jgi:hypothetical protein